MTGDQIAPALQQMIGGGGGFDPEGAEYDMDSAKRAGMQPGPDKHWGSVREATPDEIREHKLPGESYLMLKGRKHPTWDKGVEGERQRGFDVIKRGNRYWSVPRGTQ